ncbi:MAG: hypothetical protein ACAH09_01055 [Methylophilaceae bacterium]
MKFKKFFLAIFVLVVVLVVVPFLIPLGTYVTQIEQVASQKLGVPVKIESLHFAVLPTPRANVSGLVVGNNEDIRVADVAAVLDITTLFDDVRVVSKLDVDEPVLKQSAIALLGAIAAQQGESTGPAPVELRRIVVDDAKIEMDGMNLPTMDADVSLAAGGKLEKALLTSSEGNLTIDLTPKDAGYAAAIKAEKWTLPVGPKLVFDKLTANLEYAGSTLKFPQVEAALYRGSLIASGKLDWTKSWRLSGNFKTNGIELGDATPLFTRAVKVTGRITGDGKFSSIAKEPGKLADAMALDYKFSVTDGVLYGMDLVKAASLLIRQGATGGETHFDELSGTLYTRGKQIEVRPVHLVSGLLAADGHVKVMPDKSLSGRIDADIKKGVSLVTVPLAISGTMDSPMVLPTKAALAGGAAGTVLMGPLGTGLGVKAGSALDKLFGGDD